MKCVRGTISYGTERTAWDQETSYFCKKMMDVLVEGALATPSADVEHFPCWRYQIEPNNLIRFAAAATS